MTRVRVIVDRVSKTYRDRVGREVPALQEVSLTVEPEEFVAILGPAEAKQDELGRAEAAALVEPQRIGVPGHDRDLEIRHLPRGQLPHRPRLALAISLRRPAGTYC